MGNLLKAEVSESQSALRQVTDAVHYSNSPRTMALKHLSHVACYRCPHSTSSQRSFPGTRAGMGSAFADVYALQRALQAASALTPSLRRCCALAGWRRGQPERT